MKNINILSLVQAHDSLNKEVFDCFLQHHDIKFRNEELNDLKCLITLLQGLNNDVNIFNGFYVGYKIPQIGKEFDLLRFGNDSVINVELKSTGTEEKIKQQLIKNKCYLSSLGKLLHNLSYVSETKKTYILNSGNNLEEVQINFLLNLLLGQELSEIENIDSLFNPSDYLVSPFNSTDKFIRKEYFLTQHQEAIKGSILKPLPSAESANFISVVGGAGTGKTLLVYDIARELIEKEKKILIIHCGNLNEGQEKLIDNNWRIVPVKYHHYRKLSDYYAVLVDEAQRLKLEQLEKIIKMINESKGNCIFSYDKIQTLARWEERNDIDSKINEIKSLAKYKLTEKIRTNEEIAYFIKMLFNKNKKPSLSSHGNIEINYFKDVDYAKIYLSSLDRRKWECLAFTPSQYQHEHHEQYANSLDKTSHEVIGQEFDGVAVIIDKYFKYDEHGGLIYDSETYYDPVKMLLQNITRARKRVNLVIIDNEELLTRCMFALKGQSAFAD